MIDDTLIDGLDRGGPVASREQIADTIQAAKFSLRRLQRLLTAWEDGMARGSYFDARDEILAEAATARAYLGELQHIDAGMNSQNMTGLDLRPELQRLGVALEQFRERMRALGIASPCD